MLKLNRWVVVVSFLMGAASTAVADPAPPEVAGFCSLGQAGPNLTVHNLQFLTPTLSATDCYGHYNDSDNQAPSTLTTFLNSSIFDPWDQPPAGDWQFAVRDNPPSTKDGVTTGTGSTVGSLFGISWDLEATAGNTGSFLLKLTDNDLNADPNLPVKIDLVFGLKGATGLDFFFFDNVTLNTSEDGAYKLTFCQNGNYFDNPATTNKVESCTPNGLSGLSIFARDPRTVLICPPGSTEPGCKEPPDQVPEPGTLALLGLGLAMVGRSTMVRNKNTA